MSTPMVYKSNALVEASYRLSVQEGVDSENGKNRTLRRWQAALLANDHFREGFVRKQPAPVLALLE